MHLELDVMREAMGERGKGREEILEAATKEFAARGFEATSTSAIARRAGVTQPLLYHHFGSKDGLWRATVDRLFERMTQVLARAQGIDPDRPLRDQLRAMLRAYVVFSGQHRDMSRMVAFEGFVGGERYAYIYERHVGPLMENVRAMMTLAQEQGLIREIDLGMLRAIIVGSSTHLFLAAADARWFDGLEPDDPEVIERYADLVTEVLFDGLGL